MAQDGGVVMDRRFAPAGTVIVREGQAGNAAFLIQSGHVKVYVTENDGETEFELTRLGPGQFFGEMALIVDGPRTASVAALEDCNLIVLSRPALKDKLANSDPTIRALVPMLMERLAKTNAELVERCENVRGMARTVEVLYDRLSKDYSPAQKMTLDEVVAPKMKAFIAALRSLEL